MKLRIGVDIDGTLFPWTLAANAALMDRYGIEDPGEHKTWDYLEELVGDEKFSWLWSTEAAPLVFGQHLIYDGAQEAVQGLINEHEVHFVTHRNPQKTGAATAAWLAHFFANYSGLHIVTNRCRKVSLGHWDVFIDDKEETILEFCETASEVLVPDRPWNRHVEHNRLVRFSSWDEVPELIANPAWKEVYDAGRTENA